MSRSTPDETPKKAIAKAVITPKRMYFVPDHGEIEATDTQDVAKILKKLQEKQEVEDGNR